MTRVLVIDDEAPIRLLCRVNLEAEGMEVLEASDGPTGLEKARNDEPDVILLDVMMPGLDGWQVAEELLDSDLTSSIPIVFLTARAEVRDRARGLDLGGIDYVTKPFNPVELAPLVLDLIDRVDRRRARSELLRSRRESCSRRVLRSTRSSRSRSGRVRGEQRLGGTAGISSSPLTQPAKSVVIRTAPRRPLKLPRSAPMPTRSKRGSSRLRRCTGLAIHMRTIVCARASRPTPQARFSPTRGACTPTPRTRAVTEPWKRTPVRSIFEECERAARSRRASARSGRTWCASRTWFMTVNKDDSAGVGAAGCPSPAKINAATEAAAQLSTRLATSG